MSEEYFNIKVRTLKSSQFELSVNDQMPVSKLKLLISDHTKIPVERQRLIYQGKMLKLDSSLSDYKLAQEHVVQLLSSTLEPLPPNESSPVLDRLPADPTSLFIRRRRQMQRMREIEHIERLETIRQNLDTLECMLRSRRVTVTDIDNIEGFDLAQRNFSPGQWVDVMDTVDQWLEAQVVDLHDTSDGPILYIHYNGWPNRWDEWIDASSPRVQYLRTHTLQSLSSQMQSPYPVIPCDAEEIQPPSVHSINDYIMQSSYVLDRVRGMMDRYYSLSVLSRHDEGQHINDSNDNSESDFDDFEFASNRDRAVNCKQELALLTAQIPPILDRAGRLVIDMAEIMGCSEDGNRVSTLVSPLALASLNPRVRGDFDLDEEGHSEDEHDRNSCWRQIS